MFKFKKFQIEDLARGALHPGFILAWATGLGKTIAMFIWPLLKVGFDRNPTGRNRLQPLKPVLLVVPGDGHDQTDDESRKHFKTVATRLDSQATFLRLSKVNRQTGQRELPPGYYQTSYTQLTTNGVAELPCNDGLLSEPALRAAYMITEQLVIDWHADRGNHLSESYDRLGVTGPSNWNEIQAGYNKGVARRVLSNDRYLYELAREHLERLTPRTVTPGKSDWECLDDKQREYCREQVLRWAMKEYRKGIGSTCHGITCVYDPSLAQLSADSFAACVVDEGTKIQGEETLVSLGVREIRAEHRLVMSATPIKTRFPQVFRLAHFACGNHEHATARFPYGSTSGDRQDFAEEFQVGESKVDAEGKRKGRRRLTPQVANIHLAWKIFAPIILRRRKEDCGEDIVPKQRNVIRAPMGTIQKQVYDFHMNAKYEDSRGRNCVTARLTALRIVAANPKSELLKRPPAEKNLHGKVFSPYSYTPKIASALSVIQQALVRREQVLVGSAFHTATDELSARLCEAGVPHLVLDGRTTQARRGKLAAEFKIGSPRSVLEGLTQRHSQFPVVLAGVDSMAELHSFPYANNVVRTSYTWAYDKMEQFINRVHRINSPWPVNVWSIICDGSVDRVLENDNFQKADASDLVLDGHLLGENPHEVNLFELLEIAAQDFAASGETIDEPQLEKDWPALRLALALAYAKWPAFGAVKLVNQNTPRLPTPPPTPLIGLPASARVEDVTPIWKKRVPRRPA